MRLSNWMKVLFYGRQNKRQGIWILGGDLIQSMIINA